MLIPYKLVKIAITNLIDVFFFATMEVIPSPMNQPTPSTHSRGCDYT